MRDRVLVSETARRLGAYSLALVALVYFFWRVFIPALSNQTHGFPAYYTAARLVYTGQWSTKIYQGEWFADQVRAQTNGRISEYFLGHPPVTSLLVLPLAALPLPSARAVWAILNFVFLVTSCALLYDCCKSRIGPLFIPLLAVTAFLFTPIADNLRIGQSYIWQLWLFSIALWGLQRERFAATAFGLGTAAIFKLSGAPVWLFLVTRKKGRALGASVLVALAWALLSVWMLGIEGWTRFFLTVPQLAAPAPLQAHLGYQATPNFFSHLFVFDGQWNPQPLLPLPFLASLPALVVLLAVLWLTLRASHDTPLDLGFGAALTLSIILFPQAQEYHYSLLLLPYAVAASYLVPPRASWGLTVLFAMSLLLVALRLPYQAQELNDGWRALLAYPRLYGGWLLWLLLLLEMQRNPATIVPRRTVPVS